MVDLSGLKIDLHFTLFAPKDDQKKTYKPHQSDKSKEKTRKRGDKSNAKTRPLEQQKQMSIN